MDRSISATDEDSFRAVRDRFTWAAQNIPFYRDLYKSSDVEPELRSWADIERIPMVNKQMIIDDQDQAPPFGSFDVDVENLARVTYMASRYFMPLSRSDYAGAIQTYIDSYRTIGIEPSDIVDLSSAFHWVQGGTVCDSALRAIGAGVIPGGPGRSRQRLDVMQRLGVTALHAFTPYAEELAARFDDYGIDPHRDLRLRLLMVGGEMRHSNSKEALSEAWGGVTVREFYGASEAGMIAAECFTEGDGMHVGSSCLVEVIDPDTGKHVAPGEPGELVVTELFKTTQPYLRYRTGDITEGFDLRPCPCGANTIRIRRIQGRRSQILRIKGLFIDPALVDSVVRRLCGSAPWRAHVERSGRIDRFVCEVEQPTGVSEIPGLADEIKNAVGISSEVMIISDGALGALEATIEDRRQYR